MRSWSVPVVLPWLANLGLGGGDGVVVYPRSNTGKITLDGNGRRFIRDDGLQLEGENYCRCCPPCEFPIVGSRANYVAVVTVSGITGCSCGPADPFSCPPGFAPLIYTPPTVNGVHVCTWNAGAGIYTKSLGTAPNCQLSGGTTAFSVNVSASVAGNAFASVAVGAPRTAYSKSNHPICGTVNPTDVACVTDPCCPSAPGSIAPCCMVGRCSSDAPVWKPWALSSAAVTLEFQPA